MDKVNGMSQEWTDECFLLTFILHIGINNERI